MEFMNWTVETYRLDEVERKFGLPCVIHLNEGYYSLSDAEGFSQGDVMSIDSKLVLHKVAANFAKDISSTSVKNTDHDYVKLTETKEILIPLNYKGILKVIQQKKNYESVKELSTDFPRYAQLRQNLDVVTEDNKSLTIQAGTVIELDRIIPGSTFGTGSRPDCLVIQFEHLHRKAVVSLPLDLNGKFVTELDTNAYTIKEAIDRYSLPQYVRFVDDEIKRVYTQDLDEGISNVKKISDSFRLNRLVTQEVLVGHYKPIEYHTDSGHKTFKQRTMIVLPTNNPEIRDIEVNVLEDLTEDTYENIFLVRNVSRSGEDLIDGALYIDFADCPGIRRFSNKAETGGMSLAFPPPLPPKPGQIAVGRSNTIPMQRGGSKSITKPKPTINLATLPKTKPRSYSETSNTAQSDMLYANCRSKISIATDQDDYVKMNSPEQDLRQEVLEDGLNSMDIRTQNTRETSPDLVDYQEVDEFLMVPESVIKKRSPMCKKKLFRDLSSFELAERLKQGGLDDLSELCYKEKLNGAFFLNLNKDTLKKAMGLKNLQLAKFLQMRDENWIPT